VALFAYKELIVTNMAATDYGEVLIFSFSKKIKASPKEGEERLALFSGQLGLPISYRDVCKEALS
jgi:hypothetical protein